MRVEELLDAVDCVVFDVGETLVDETYSWTKQAESAGVTPFTLMGVLGALIERGEDHRVAWSLLAITDVPSAPPVRADDLYPDAELTLRTLRRAGLRVGIAGNQPAGVVEQLGAVGFTADFIASSSAWGVSKPSPGFFQRVLAECGMDASRVLYVGDRLDNDVLPARACGMRTALIRRGPWGVIHSNRPDARLADVRIDALAELAAAASRRAGSGGRLSS